MIIASTATPCHIASIVLWVGDGAAMFQQELSDLAWADFPMAAEGGKCIAVLEAASDEELIKRIDWFRELPEVVNAQLVYHAFDEDE